VKKHREIERPTLGTLAFTSYVFGPLTDYDKSLKKFRDEVNGSLDLGREDHRLALFDWLNKWGCRLPLASRAAACRQIGAWYEEHAALLPSGSDRLSQLSAKSLDAMGNVFSDLSERLIGGRANGGSRSLGSTAASKTLYALRPQVFMPWDGAMRAAFDCDGSGESYVRFLKLIREDLVRLDEEARRLDRSLPDLPAFFDQSGRTPIDLINQFYWLTITRRATPPDESKLTKWLDLLKSRSMTIKGDTNKG